MLLYAKARHAQLVIILMAVWNLLLLDSNGFAMPRQKMSILEACNIVGVKDATDLAAVKQAKRRKMKQWHPDVFGDDGAKMRLLLEAVDVLEKPHTAGPGTSQFQTPSSYSAPTSSQDARPEKGKRELWFRALCTIKIRLEPAIGSQTLGAGRGTKTIKQGELFKAEELSRGVFDPRPAEPQDVLNQQVYLRLPKPLDGWVFSQGIAGHWQNTPIISFAHPEPERTLYDSYKALCDIRIRQYPNEDSPVIRQIKKDETVIVTGELVMSSPYINWMKKQKFLRLQSGGWAFLLGISGEWENREIFRKLPR